MKRLWKIMPWPLKGLAILIPIAGGTLYYFHKTDINTIYMLPLYTIMLILAFINEGIMRRKRR